MKTLDLIAGICFGSVCLLAIIVTIVQTRFDLLAVAFVTGLVAVFALQEYRELKRKES